MQPRRALLLQDSEATFEQMPLSLIVLATATAVMAGDAPEEATSSQRQSAAEELDAAIGDYLNGDWDEARLALIRLARDPRLTDNPVLRRRVRIYLGEVLYVMGERDTSWETFVSVVLEDPDYQMDPFVHPPDVVTFFESARDYARRFLPDETVAPELTQPLLPPLPWALLPGRLQFHNDQNGLGYLAIGGVALATSTAFGLSSYLRAQDDFPNVNGINLRPSRQDEEAMLIVLKDVRDATAIVTAGLWATAVLQGTIRASRAPQRAEVDVSLSVGPGGESGAAALTVRW